MKYVLLVIACFSFLPQAESGPKTSVGKNWPESSQVSMDRINHAPWDQLLKQFVDDKGNVNYTAWKSSPEARNLLTAYLNHLSQASSSIPASKEGQLAFWINAYNAVTVEGILRVYPTTSIRNHTAKLYGYNIWHDLLLQVNSQKVSLDHIEHKILRTMKEPRIHFAIVCASHSCPTLRNEAYVASKLEQQLVSNSQVFFANPENFSFNEANQTIILSAILKWFAEDFGKNQKEQLKSIALFLPGVTAQRLALSGDVKISYASYNWSLNDAKTKDSR